MLGLSFHTSASGGTVATFMTSCANAEPANAIKAPKNRSCFIDSLPSCLQIQGLGGKQPQHKLDAETSAPLLQSIDLIFRTQRRQSGRHQPCPGRDLAGFDVKPMACSCRIVRSASRLHTM